MSKEDGGSAFPTTQYANGISPSGHDQGMTLRDYFAAKAMQAIVDSSQYQCGGGLNSLKNLQGVAEDSYGVADAMLKARQA